MKNLLILLDNPNGGVAQLGEHLPCKQGVKSSNLSISIRQRKNLAGRLESRKEASGNGSSCTLKTSYRDFDKKFFIKTSEITIKMFVKPNETSF